MNTWTDSKTLKGISIDQLDATGIYSSNLNIKNAALLQNDIAAAKKGNTNALNECYAAKKSGKLTADEYTKIRKCYDGKNVESDI